MGDILIGVTGIFLIALSLYWYFEPQLVSWKSAQPTPLQKAERILRRKNFDAAIRKYSQIINKQPANIEAYLGRSNAYMHKNELSNAIADCDTVSRLQPDNPHAFLYRGAVNSLQNNHEEALKEYTKCLELQPEYLDAFVNRAETYSRLGKIKNSIQDYSKAIEITPTDASLYLYRAYQYLYSKEFTKAITDSSHAIELGVQSTDCFWVRGHAHYRIKEYTKAKSDYENAIRIDAMHSHILNSLAWLLASCREQNIRDGEKAVKLATQSCELGDYGEWYLVGTLAAAHAETSNFDEAIKWAEKSLVMAPEEERKNCENRIYLYRQHQPYIELD